MFVRALTVHLEPSPDNGSYDLEQVNQACFVTAGGGGGVRRLSDTDSTLIRPATSDSATSVRRRLLLRAYDRKRVKASSMST